MGEGILKPIPQLINSIYETGQWTTHFTDVTMIALKKNPKATKYTDPRTMSPNTHATKLIAKTNKSRERKLWKYLWKISLALEKKNEIRTHLGCED